MENPMVKRLIPPDRASARSSGWQTAVSYRKSVSPPKLKLVDQVRQALRVAGSLWQIHWIGSIQTALVNGAASGCSRRSIGGRTARQNNRGWHHVHESIVQKAVAQAVRDAGLTKRATCHTSAIASPRVFWLDGYDIRMVHELMGHKDVKTTMISTHVLNRGGKGVRNLADTL